MWTPASYTNINFPAPIAALAFLGACGGLVLSAIAVAIAYSAGKLKLGRRLMKCSAAGAVVYLSLLLGFSLASHEAFLSLGAEKYFCELDCHLAYSIASVQTAPEAGETRYKVALKTRFDETTTSPQRPKDAPLTPNPRLIRLVDERGQIYAPVGVVDTVPATPLAPGQSYLTKLDFLVPRDVRDVRLLVTVAPQWEDRLLIGDENSFLHKKTYFRL